MKLIDKALAEGWLYRHNYGGDDRRRRCRATTPSMVVSLSTQMHDFILNQVFDQESGCYGPLRSPGEKVWIEWERPLVSTGIPIRLGAFAVEAPITLDSGEEAIELLLQPLMWERGKKPIPILYGMIVLVDRLGQYISGKPRPLWPDLYMPTMDEYMALGIDDIDEPWKKEIGWAATISAVAAGAIGFINAKNVALDRHEPPAKLSRAHQRRTGGPPLVTWNTIRLPKVSTSSGDTIRGNKKDATPLHLVRGHFKTYTEEHPLFGNRTGTYWWTAMVRGNAKNGIALHDYELQADSQ